MNQTDQLVSALKRSLKARGLTYRDVAQHLGLTQPDRMLSRVKTASASSFLSDDETRRAFQQDRLFLVK